MSLLGDIALGIASPLGLVGKKVFFDKPAEEQQRADQLAWDIGEERKKSKQQQLGFVDQMQAPQVSPYTERRLAALESESQPGALVSDPFFQGQRATLAQGGAQALAGVQNRNAAYDTSGGFSNKGSINDVYDRLGAQMAQLGERSQNLKSQKADAVAQARQQMMDAQTSYTNSVLQAKAAIEAGDSSSAMQALQQAYNTKNAIDAAQRKMFGQVASIGGTIAGGMVGGPPGAAVGSQAGNAMDIGYDQPEIAGDDYAEQASLPAAYLRGPRYPGAGALK